MIKRSKQLLVLSLILALSTLILSVTLTPTQVNAQTKETYSVVTNDEYFAETTYFLTQNVYENFFNESAPTKVCSERVSTSLSNNEDKFAFAVSQKVYVLEQTNAIGDTVESRLLKKNEIAEYSMDNSVNVYSNSNEEVGTDAEYMYYLTINMIVTYNTNTSQYKITGTASWDPILVWAWESNKAAEEFYHDYIGITWGGNNTLAATSYSISGIYYGGDAVSFSRKASNTTAGYVWQFKEKSGYLGKEMKNATANVQIAKSGTHENKQTCARMTYIHTYGTINGSVSINANSDATIAAGVTLSQTQKQWQIEIDVYGLEF